MSLPRKLKKMHVFEDGVTYSGDAKTVTLPKLTRKMEEYRGGAMSGPVKIDHGHELLEMEHEYGGFMPNFMANWGGASVDAHILRFSGVYQNDQTGAADLVEIFVRGRHEEVEGGEAKVGDDTTFKVKTALSYYRLEVNGAAIVELDPINGIDRRNGVDVNPVLNALLPG